MDDAHVTDGRIHQKSSETTNPQKNMKVVHTCSTSSIVTMRISSNFDCTLEEVSLHGSNQGTLGDVSLCGSYAAAVDVGRNKIVLAPIRLRLRSVSNTLGPLPYTFALSLKVSLGCSDSLLRTTANPQGRGLGHVCILAGIPRCQRGDIGVMAKHWLN